MVFSGSVFLITVFRKITLLSSEAVVPHEAVLLEHELSVVLVASVVVSELDVLLLEHELSVELLA